MSDPKKKYKNLAKKLKVDTKKDTIVSTPLNQSNFKQRTMSRRGYKMKKSSMLSNNSNIVHQVYKKLK
jgi:hypothetical protein